MQVCPQVRFYKLACPVINQSNQVGGGYAKVATGGWAPATDHSAANCAVMCGAADRSFVVVGVPDAGEGHRYFPHDSLAVLWASNGRL